MNNLLKNYEFFIKEKYIIFAADETKAAESGAFRTCARYRKKMYIFSENRVKLDEAAGKLPPNML